MFLKKSENTLELPKGYAKNYKIGDRSIYHLESKDYIKSIDGYFFKNFDCNFIDTDILTNDKTVISYYKRITNYKINKDKMLIYKIPQQTNIYNLRSNIDQSIQITIYDNKGNEILDTNNILCTGYQLHMTSMLNDVDNNLKISILGDVNGDGIANIDDAKIITKYVLDKNNLKDEEFLDSVLQFENEYKAFDTDKIEETVVDNTVSVSFTDLELTLKDTLVTGTYKVEFSLYDTYDTTVTNIITDDSGNNSAKNYTKKQYEFIGESYVYVIIK